MQYKQYEMMGVPIVRTQEAACVALCVYMSYISSMYSSNLIAFGYIL